MTHPDRTSELILIAGASGYVGGRLVKALSEQGHSLRCLARKPKYLAGRVPAEIEVVAGDVLDPDSLRPALAGVHTAYYLVHSMGAAGDFEDKDRRAAWIFGAAAQEAGVKRIIYLGGLGSADGTMSAHLLSRHEVGEVLRRFGLQVIEFRAPLQFGSVSWRTGSLRGLEITRSSIRTGNGRSQFSPQLSCKKAAPHTRERKFTKER